MTSSTSTSRIVYTLQGPKIVDSSNPYPHGRPLPGAPVARPCVVSSPESWKCEAPPPYLTSSNRSESVRLGRSSRSAPYTLPPPRSGQTTMPHSPTSASSGYFYISQDARRRCLERIKVELDAISKLDANALSAMIAVERERDTYRVAAEAAQKELRRVAEERDHLREQFEALSLKENRKISRNSSSPSEEFVQKSSSVGPQRRKSASLNTSHSSWANDWFNSQPRCKSADPCISGARGVNDCFDVTVVAPALPPQPCSPRKYADSEPSELIRDASRPTEAPRHCRPINKPKELGIRHIDILYIPLNGRLDCRACQVNKLKTPSVKVKAFPDNASWDELRDHWLVEHQRESGEVAKLNAADIYTYRQRLREFRPSSN